MKGRRGANILDASLGWGCKIDTARREAIFFIFLGKVHYLLDEGGKLDDSRRGTNRIG